MNIITIIIWLLSQLKQAKDGRFYVVQDGKPKYIRKGVLTQFISEYSDNDYDREYSEAAAIQAMGGRPYTKESVRHGGYALIESCDHEECTISHIEQLWEMNNEVCCGEDCNHHTAIFCQFPEENEKEEDNMTSKNTQTGPICGKCSHWDNGVKVHVHHATVADIRECYLGAQQEDKAEEVVEEVKADTSHITAQHVITIEGGEIKFFRSREDALELTRLVPGAKMSRTKKGGGFKVVLMNG